MTEIFANVSNTIKDVAEKAWYLASKMQDPVMASDFLDNVTNYYSYLCTEEEIEFLQFYFNMKLEMMKE